MAKLLTNIPAPRRRVMSPRSDSSVRPWISENYEVAPDSFHKTLRAVNATPDEALVLSVGKGTPLLEVEQVGYLDDGRPFEYLLARFPGDLAEYQTVDSDSLPV